MTKTLTAIVLVLAAVAAAVGGFMWWKSKKKPEAATQEVRDQTRPPADTLSIDDFDPTSRGAKYGNVVNQGIETVVGWFN